ncbi:putative transmembrane protein [Rhizoctonia solani 123E]|uniref:Putative transmembrane protein n=1 Tax=Rhizoctonia solani 123E TaxID=1423351 RepID=A0A074S401_9AGAM|nr:putative transmembrane protein [Rhizoctonia solani 123E]
MTVTIAATAQGFFTWRINRLTGCKWLSGGIALIIAMQFAAGAASTIGAFIVVDFMRFGELKAQISLWLVTSALADTAITITLSWYLHSNRTGFSRTDDIITKLIRITVQTGLITTVWALVDLIMFLAVPNPLHLMFNLPLPKLYSISLLSTLNARGGWGNDSMGLGRNTTGGISIPVSIEASHSHEHQPTVPQRFRGLKKVNYEETSFEMEVRPKPRAQESTDVQRDEYSAHQIKHDGDRSAWASESSYLPM